MTFPVVALTNQWTDGEDLDAVDMYNRVDSNLNALRSLVLTARQRITSPTAVSGTGFGTTTGTFYLANGVLAIPNQGFQYRATITANVLLSSVTAAAEFVGRIQRGATGAFASYSSTASPAGTDCDEDWTGFTAASTAGRNFRPSFIYDSNSSGTGQDFVLLLARTSGTGTGTLSASSVVNRLEALIEFL